MAGLTIPRRYPSPAPAGEYQTECAYCGMTWYRSDLFRDPAGYLVCPDDAEGRDVVTLGRLEQEGTAAALAEVQRLRREPW